MEATRKVDRFSSLPIELLSTIFELVHGTYRDHVLDVPLSKSLRPLYEREIYRCVAISSSKWTKLLKFASAVERYPSRGHHVRDLEVEFHSQGNRGAESEDESDDDESEEESEGESVGESGEESSSSEEERPARKWKRGEDKNDRPKITEDQLAEKIQALLPLCPKLVKLSLPYPCLEPLKSVLASGITFSGLRHLSFPPAEHRASHFDVGKISWLSDKIHLPALGCLELAWKSFKSVSPAIPGLFQQIRTLEFQYGPAAEASILALIDSCPSLTRVIFMADSGETQFDEILACLPTSLTFLGIYHTDLNPDPVDHLLHRFTSLEYLGLADGMYTQQIHLVLPSLPHLERLHLEEPRTDVDGIQVFRNIVELLPTLKLKELDLLFMNACNGPRYDPDAAKPKDFNEEPGWYLFEWKTEQYLEAKRLIEIAREAGVELGSEGIVGMVELFESHLVERYNRSVAVGSTTGDFTRVNEIVEEARQSNYPLPSLDLDSLDLDRLEYVKIPLPEQEWFILSLKNREE